MTAPSPESLCVLCSSPMTVAMEPPRRTLARGLDPSDESYSVTVILPDIPLCDEHADDVRQGQRLVGWCDDPLCRTYGEVGQASPCGEEYMKLATGSRPRSPRIEKHI
jgi:hypothetical protein